MRTNKTIHALLARGIQSCTAEELVAKGYSVRKLQQLTQVQLQALLPEDNIAVDVILKSSRPPIPKDTLIELLHESRYCCCICRDNTRSIVIHHIVPWDVSHSHAKENLVVLCHQHHDEAHTTHKLSLSLSPERILALKEAWLQQVLQSDDVIVHDIIMSEYICWDFFNHNRIYELVGNTHIDPRELKNYSWLYSQGLVNETGEISPNCFDPNEPRRYWLAFGYGMFLQSYIESLFRELAPKYKWTILNEIWSKEKILAQCKAGDLVILQGAFYFKKLNKVDEGFGQDRSGKRRYKNIQLDFTFDAWYCNSTSSRCTHLCGRRVATVFAIIREIASNNETSVLHIRCSALAIGSWLDNITSGRSLYFGSPDSEDDDDFDQDDMQF